MVSQFRDQIWLLFLSFYREIDDEDEEGSGDEEEFEDGEQLPPESDTEESEYELGLTVCNMTSLYV